LEEHILAVLPSGIATTSLAEGAYARLRHAIVTGAVAPGSWLREKDVADQFEISRTPVREALRRLSCEGLVRLVPGRGALVTDIDATRLREIYSVRAILEGAAARELAQRLPASIRGLLGGLVDEMADLVATGKDDLLRQANKRFHMTIADAAGNDFRAQLLHAMESELERFRFLALRDPDRRMSA
jgi:DNA-binding GntR family transcriptional regulator